MRSVTLPSRWAFRPATARVPGAQLNSGVFNGVRILSEESVAGMQRNQVPPMTEAVQAAVGAGYGLGLGTFTTPEGYTTL